MTATHQSQITAPEAAVTSLDPAACWAMLVSTEIGRLATSVDGKPDIFPINFAVHDGTILFRSAPGSKLENLTSNPMVAFEADGVSTRWYWSVVVHGTAVRLHDADDIIRSGVMQLTSWDPTDKWNYLQITPSDITGRQIGRHVVPRAQLWG